MTQKKETEKIKIYKKGHPLSRKIFCRPNGFKCSEIFSLSMKSLGQLSPNAMYSSQLSNKQIKKDEETQLKHCILSVYP